MRCLLRVARSWTAVVFVGVSAVGAHAGGLGFDDGGSAATGSVLVAGLGLSSHLDPLSPEQVRSTEFMPTAYSIDAQPRLSMPAVDRSRGLVVVDLFPNTKMVAPLLVSDLNPGAESIDRLTSARSVGARPSLPFLVARPLTRSTGR